MFFPKFLEMIAFQFRGVPKRPENVVANPAFLCGMKQKTLAKTSFAIFLDSPVSPEMIF